MCAYCAIPFIVYIINIIISVHFECLRQINKHTKKNNFDYKLGLIFHHNIVIASPISSVQCEVPLRQCKHFEELIYKLIWLLMSGCKTNMDNKEMSRQIRKITNENRHNTILMTTLTLWKFCSNYAMIWFSTLVF